MQKRDARRWSLGLTIAALGAILLLAVVGLTSFALSGAELGTAFLIAAVFWFGSVILAVPVAVAAIMGIVLGARSRTPLAVVLGGVALACLAVGGVWLLTAV